jgi:hypothetical protein
MWIQLLIFIVVSIISALLAPKQQNAVPGSPSGAPSIADTQQVPVCFGTCDFEQPNLVWYGDLKTTPIKTSGGKKG